MPLSILKQKYEYINKTQKKTKNNNKLSKSFDIEEIIDNDFNQITYNQTINKNNN